MELKLHLRPKLKRWDRSLVTFSRAGQYVTGIAVDKLWRVGLLAGVSLTFIYVALNLLVSWQWVNQPFAGFLHQNRVVTESALPGWQARQDRIGQVQILEGDVIVLADNRPVPSSQWLTAYVRQIGLNHPVTYSLLTANHQTVQTVAAIELFTLRHFMQLIAIPTFIAFIVLVSAGLIVYLKADQLPVKLFSLFSLALVWGLAGSPSFTAGNFFIFNFIIVYLGKIVTPILLVHFLLIFLGWRKTLQEQPFLLPVIYLPVIPALVHVPILLVQPETTHSLNIIIDSYSLAYGAIGLALLFCKAFTIGKTGLRQQTVVLALGLAILPLLLLFGLAWPFDPIEYTLLYKILARYAFVGLPVAAIVAIVRYQLFGLTQTQRSHFFYVRAIITALIGYFLLIILLVPSTIPVRLLQRQALVVMGLAALTFILLRFLYRYIHRWWLNYHFYNTLQELRASYRIFSHDLLKVRSRRDLELLVGWNIPHDFGLRHAELSDNNLPSHSYALRLPLSVGKILLGTLFLGPKVGGGNFKEQELALFTELQKQVSLVLFSLELNEAIRITEQLTELRSRFLANVTHELRTPLNGIINYIGFVIDDHYEHLNSEQREHLEQALQNAEKLVQIINNILDISKIEAGQMSLNLQPVSLAEVVSNTRPAIEEMLKHKPVTLITEVHPALPTLYGDRLRLRQIILNMLTNAAKFTNAGSIHLNAYAQNGSVIVKISDTGIGIAEKDLPNIFQQFTASGLTDANQNAGPGLSLPITKALIELHGGKLDVESLPGNGTTFTFTLPIKQEIQIEEVMQT